MQTIIKVPRYITRKWTPKMKKQLKLFQAAKGGSRRAMKALEKHCCMVWMDDEIQACNYYLSIKDTLTNEGRMANPGTIKLLRYLDEGLVDADILWIQYVQEGYYLLCAEWPEGGLTLWVCTFKGALFQPLCDVTSWSNINEESE